MENRLTISDFAKLTGTTLKTILYYHKIGLLQEPERSPAGYRLYGPSELTRIQLIKHLKSLGLDLKRIKVILGDIDNPRTWREALDSLRADLLNEKASLENRIDKIELTLSKEKEFLNEEINESSSFQMMTEILGPEQIEKYSNTIPELFEQHRKARVILDDYKWGKDYQETYRGLAEYFQAHPEQYQISLDFGVRLAEVAKLAKDDPEVEMLARESAEFIKSIPQLSKLLCNQQGIKKPLESLFNDMISEIISPAQIKFNSLLQKYLNS